MATQVSTPPAVHAIYNQPTSELRWVECTTEGRHMESLFMLADHGRDSHVVQILTALPHIKFMPSVIRDVHLKLDQHDPKNYPKLPNPRGQKRPRPYRGQFYRCETRIVSVGRTSLKMQHRFFIVPNSQLKRDFNNRSQDALYQTLDKDEEPERLFASVDGTMVFVKWETGPDGRSSFKSTPGPNLDDGLVCPSVVDYVGGPTPIVRGPDCPRPPNAFRVSIHLRKSDEDQLGHVTNSRYVTLLHDVLTFGLRSGYYSNGSGSSTTTSALPVIVYDAGQNKDSLDKTVDIAVPAGSRYYKKANVHELYVGYHQELKVKPGVIVWSWVEQDRVEGRMDKIRFEICAMGEDGQERIVNVSRALVREVEEVGSSL